MYIKKYLLKMSLTLQINIDILKDYLSTTCPMFIQKEHIKY